MRYGLLVIGPAGSGKSTFCNALQQHMEILHRSCNIVNLDPAAEFFLYKPCIDVRDVITVDEAAGELGLGPNGGLVYAMEFLQQHMDWLEEQLYECGGEGDFFVFDCPGQIELYTHLPLMKNICMSLQRTGLRLAACCCLDVSFMNDAAKFLGGSLVALSAMVQLELPHINLLTKCDLIARHHLASSQVVTHRHPTTSTSRRPRGHQGTDSRTGTRERKNAGQRDARGTHAQRPIHTCVDTSKQTAAASRTSVDKSKESTAASCTVISKNSSTDTSQNDDSNDSTSTSSNISARGYHSSSVAQGRDSSIRSSYSSSTTSSNNRGFSFTEQNTHRSSSDRCQDSSHINDDYRKGSSDKCTGCSHTSADHRTGSNDSCSADIAEKCHKGSDILSVPSVEEAFARQQQRGASETGEQLHKDEEEKTKVNEYKSGQVHNDAHKEVKQRNQPDIDKGLEDLSSTDKTQHASSEAAGRSFCNRGDVSKTSQRVVVGKDEDKYREKTSEEDIEAEDEEDDEEEDDEEEEADFEDEEDEEEEESEEDEEEVTRKSMNLKQRTNASYRGDRISQVGGYKIYSSTPNSFCWQKKRNRGKATQEEEDLAKERAIDALLSRDTQQLLHQLDQCTPGAYRNLNAAFANLLEDYNLVSFLPCDITEEDSLSAVALVLEQTLQYGEDMEVREADIPPPD